jgi:hypothetical protein
MTRAEANKIIEHARKRGWEMIYECYTADDLLLQFGGLPFLAAFRSVRSIARTWMELAGD